jgi:peroxiredoxin
MRHLLASLLLLGLIQSASASFSAELGPVVGSEVPSFGTPDDHNGKQRSLESLMGEKGLVLVFYRSAGWCPFCQSQLIDLNKGNAEIEKRGYKLAGVSYDAPKVLTDFVSKRSIQYTLLSDPKSEIIDRYGLRDPQYKQGSMAYGVPKPIIFILDRKGTVRTKFYEDDYKKRPPIGLVIETLDTLASAQK